MGKLNTSKKAKDNYTLYKNSNKVEKNKIAKLTRHCKEFPNDEVGKENLARIKKDGYKPRSKPLSPGSNPTTPKIRLQVGHAFGPRTAGEQLSELLGIPIPKQRSQRKSKPTITHKPRKK